MAYGIPSATNEYPHSAFYDSDLSEILKFYKKLVDEYNEIVEKLHKAEKDWIDSRNYVEWWNRKWQNDFIELRNEFNRVTAQMEKVQKEIIQRFTDERIGMEKYLDNVMENIFSNNSDTADRISKSLKDYYGRYTTLNDNYRNSLKQMLDEFNKVFDASLQVYDMHVAENLDNFKLFVSNEMDAIMSLISSTDASIDDFYSAIIGQYNLLLVKYDNKLETELYNAELKFKETLKNYTELDEYIQQGWKINQLEKRIEEVNKARVDIQADKVLVKSPVTNRMKRIQWVLDEMWLWYRQWAIEAREFDALDLTAEQFDNFVCDKGKLPNFIGIEALDFDAMARWILLEKPDIISRLEIKIDEITYNALSENKDKIAEEIATNAITTTTSHFAAIINSVSVIAERMDVLEEVLEDATITINKDGNYTIRKE